MKPAQFEYIRAKSVADAITALSAHEGDARIIAGGQSLAPMLHMRLIQPTAIVDINHIDGLNSITGLDESTVIGATCRYSTLEESLLIAKRLPLLQQALRYVGDRQVRNRGTLIGSLVQADPLSEASLVSLVLDATIVAQGPSGTREIGIEDFIEGPYSTALESNEVAIEVKFPLASKTHAFFEVGRRHNDYAVLAIAISAECATDGLWRRLRLGMIGAEENAILIHEAGEILNGSTLDDVTIERAVAATLEVVDPPSDARGTADYRRHIIGVHVRRLLSQIRYEQVTLRG